MKSKTFKELSKINKAIASRFEKIEGRPWGAEGSIVELMKQVGELSKLIMVRENYYAPDRSKFHQGYESGDGKIGDELADALFVLLRIADHYHIDLEKAFLESLEGAARYLKQKGA